LPASMWAISPMFRVLLISEFSGMPRSFSGGGKDYG
jgi:hypothetical protein